MAPPQNEVFAKGAPIRINTVSIVLQEFFVMFRSSPFPMIHCIIPRMQDSVIELSNIFHIIFVQNWINLKLTKTMEKLSMLLITTAECQFLIAVFIYCLVMISIDLSETTQKSAPEIQDNIRDKFSPRKNPKNFFFLTKFFLGPNLSRITYRSCISYAIILYFFSVAVELQY